MIEALRSRRGPFEPARDRVAGMARDSGRRRNTHALDAQACDLIELPSRAAKPTVRSPRVRAERAPADCAAVPLPSAGLGRKRAVAHDVKARLSTVVTPGGSARHPIGRVHGSSVPAGETPRVPHDCRGAADRSTANGASTGAAGKRRQGAIVRAGWRTRASATNPSSAMVFAPGVQLDRGVRSSSAVRSSIG